jgi:signal transduction histidine kinase
MSKLTSFARRHMLWLGFFAALVPLVVLLCLQYGWLVSLEETSVVAHRATLDNFLEAVASEVEYFYRGVAERVLNVPSTLFTGNLLDSAASHFATKRPQGARHLFVLSFYGEDTGRLLFYDPVIPSMEPPADPEVVRAVYVAAAPWRELSAKGERVRSVAVACDEKDPDNRIVLNPITDESSRVVGVAGMIVDQRFFKEALLPRAIKESLPAFFSERDSKDLDVTVRDAKGHLEFATAERDEAGEEAHKSFTFVMTDWKLGLTSHGLDPKEWARASFALNMGLSILLGVVLLGGMTLALRTASREMRLSQMKGDFVSNVSHELRTPLASIRVFGEFLKLGRATTAEKVREYGDYIETESRRLTRLIDNILDFSRIESGAKTYRFRSTDVGEVLEETLRMFEVRLRNTGFTLALARPAGPLPPAVIDPDAIAQALNNLIDNAVKYSNRSGEIVLSAEDREGWILISVKDSGIGISRAEQKKVFERFHRISTGLVHDVKGSGLGLSIVRHIVEAHHGRVTLESEPGRGSTFTIHLPVAMAADAGAAAGKDSPLSVEDSHA